MSQLAQIRKIAETIREQVLEGENPLGMCQRVNEPIANHIVAELGVPCTLVNVDLSGKSWSPYNHHYFVRLEDGTVIDGVFDQMGNRDEIYIGHPTVWHYGKTFSEKPVKSLRLRRKVLS